MNLQLISDIFYFIDVQKKRNNYEFTLNELFTFYNKKYNKDILRRILIKFINDKFIKLAKKYKSNKNKYLIK